MPVLFKSLIHIGLVQNFKHLELFDNRTDRRALASKHHRLVVTSIRVDWNCLEIMLKRVQT